MNIVFQRRFDYWQAWKKDRGCEGDLYNLPGTDSSIDYPALQAQEEFGRLLDEKEFKDTAVLCTNMWTALGVVKAMENRGLQVGRAISVCTINDELLAPWLNPSLTALQMPGIEPMLAKCVKWMMSGGRNWRGPKLLTPKDVPLYEGDSTGSVTGN
jgi:DNA-binding LacI/PurR family transcriptional regulator